MDINMIRVGDEDLTDLKQIICDFLNNEPVQFFRYSGIKKVEAAPKKYLYNHPGLPLLAWKLVHQGTYYSNVPTRFALMLPAINAI